MQHAAHSTRQIRAPQTSRSLRAMALGLILALGGASALGLSPAALAQSTAPDAVAKALDEAIAPAFKEGQPGAAVLVVKDGKTLLRKGYGLADMESKRAIQAGDVFRIGSITKQFTAVAIMMLEEEGKLSLQDEITRFIPDYPTQGKKITVEHLLTHTSGIQSYTDMPGFRAIMQKDLKPLEMVDFFKNEPMQFAPGERFAYNNSGYFLLGVVIEKASGLSYADFVARRIFEPLEMRDTAFEGHERVGGGKRIAGYAASSTDFVPAPPMSMSLPYAAGSLVSTVDDLARWNAAIEAGRLLKPDTWKRVFTPYTLNSGKKIAYAYGWNTRKLRGEPAIEHGGAINGFVSQGVRLPESKVLVVVLMNAIGRQPGPGYLADKLAAIAAGKPFPTPTPIALKPETLDRFEGTYRIDEKQTRVISREGENLTLQRGGNKFQLRPYRDNEFFIPGASFSRFRFENGPDGKVNRMVVLEGPDGDEINPRIGDKPSARKQVVLPPEKFDLLVGDYQLAPNFVLTVSREGDKYLTQATGQGKLEVLAESETLLFAKDIAADLLFQKDAEGKVTGLVLKQSGREMPAKKIK